MGTDPGAPTATGPDWTHRPAGGGVEAVAFNDSMTATRRQCAASADATNMAFALTDSGRGADMQSADVATSRPEVDQRGNVRSVSEPGISVPGVLVLTGILAAGVLIRCHRLEEISYWFDESFCWKLITFDWNELWDRVGRDNHPPLYFALLKGWVEVFGPSAVAMRSLSIVFGMLAVLGAFALVREVQRSTREDHDPVAAYVAAALMAISVVQLDWSQQVRMYSLASCLGLWSCVSLIRFLAQPSARQAIVPAIVFVMLASALTYTHYYGLFLVAAQFLFALGTAFQRGSKRLLWIAAVCLAFVAIGLAWTPWLPVFLKHREQVDQAYWTRDFVVLDLVNSCVRFWIGERWEWKTTGAAGIAVAALMGLVWFGLLFQRGGTRLLGLGPLVTFGLASAASLTGRNIVSPRYFILAQVLTICGLALIVRRLPGWWLRQGTTFGLVAVFAVLCWHSTQRRDELAARPGFQSAVAYLEEVRQPGEAIVVANPMIQVTVAAYVLEPGQVFVVGQPAQFIYYQGTAALRDSEYLTDEAVANWPTDRIWVVDTEHWTGGTKTVPLPHPWIDLREQAFYDWFSPRCRIIVRECVRRRSARELSASVSRRECLQ